MDNPTESGTAIIQRGMYSATLHEFYAESPESVLGKLVGGSSGSIELTQRNAWLEQVSILKSVSIPNSLTEATHIYFELTVPRLGRRVDVALIAGHVLFIIEFKVGENTFPRHALDQVWDYALDFKLFHESSHDICILPILVATEAAPQSISIQTSAHNDRLAKPIGVSPAQLSSAINAGMTELQGPPIDIETWSKGRYLPTPTIVEAAKALYAGHSVENISRNDAGSGNLSITSKAIDRIISHSKENNRKSICFLTGVPGAGKTLVGLDVATRHLDPKSETYSVFLSGNGPLVAVLREALTRDRVLSQKAAGESITKVEARKEVDAFIQNVHHFRDEYLKDTGAPPEHVVLFDEAQRAWNIEQTSAFMKLKKGKANFSYSEPEFLISCLDRHKDWAVVVCLVGSGQEINTGEGGITEWFEAIERSFQSWDIYLSPHLISAEYTGGQAFDRIIEKESTHKDKSLHLATSMRSFRAETLSRFVREVLDLEHEAARQTLQALQHKYPLHLTRSLNRAKQWLKEKARGSERYGLVVSSRAERLKPHAIDVRVKTDPIKWFLDGKDDTRSSYYLEDAATEFQVQGLELDWACVVWDGDLRFNGASWAHHQFRGSKWSKINKPERQHYLKNAYRVLMTRARQGMVIVVPEGSSTDPTRDHSFYDPTYLYLKSLGIQEI